MQQRHTGPSLFPLIAPPTVLSARTGGQLNRSRPSRLCNPSGWRTGFRGWLAERPGQHSRQWTGVWAPAARKRSVCSNHRARIERVQRWRPVRRSGQPDRRHDVHNSRLAEPQLRNRCLAVLAVSRHPGGAALVRLKVSLAGNRDISCSSKSAVSRCNARRPNRARGSWRPHRFSVALLLLVSRDFEELGTAGPSRSRPSSASGSKASGRQHRSCAGAALRSLAARRTAGDELAVKHYGSGRELALAIGANDESPQERGRKGECVPWVIGKAPRAKAWCGIRN